MRKVDGDGNCFLSSLQDQLALHRLSFSLKRLRELAVEGIDDEIDAMAPHVFDCFLEDEGVSNREEYIKKMKLDKTYLNVPEIQSLAKALNVTIYIHSVSVDNKFDSSCINPSNNIVRPITVKVDITIPCTAVNASAENVSKRKLAKSTWKCYIAHEVAEQGSLSKFEYALFTFS